MNLIPVLHEVSVAVQSGKNTETGTPGFFQSTFGPSKDVAKLTGASSADPQPSFQQFLSGALGGAASESLNLPNTPHSESAGNGKVTVAFAEPPPVAEHASIAGNIASKSGQHSIPQSGQHSIPQSDQQSVPHSIPISSQQSVPESIPESIPKSSDQSRSLTDTAVVVNRAGDGNADVKPSTKFHPTNLQPVSVSSLRTDDTNNSPTNVQATQTDLAKSGTGKEFPTDVHGLDASPKAGNSSAKNHATDLQGTETGVAKNTIADKSHLTQLRGTETQLNTSHPNIKNQLTDIQDAATDLVNKQSTNEDLTKKHPTNLFVTDLQKTSPPAGKSYPTGLQDSQAVPLSEPSTGAMVSNFANPVITNDPVPATPLPLADPGVTSHRLSNVRRSSEARTIETNVSEEPSPTLSLNAREKSVRVADLNPLFVRSASTSSASAAVADMGFSGAEKSVEFASLDRPGQVQTNFGPGESIWSVGQSWGTTSPLHSFVTSPTTTNATNTNATNIMEPYSYQAVERQVIEVVTSELAKEEFQIRMRLDPPHLGTVAVDVRRVADGLRVHFGVDNALAADTLATDIQTLEQSLKESDLDLLEVTVSLGQHSSEGEHHAATNTATQFEIDESDPNAVTALGIQGVIDIRA